MLGTKDNLAGIALRWLSSHPPKQTLRHQTAWACRRSPISIKNYKTIKTFSGDADLTRIVGSGQAGDTVRSMSLYPIPKL